MSSQPLSPVGLAHGQSPFLGVPASVPTVRPGLLANPTFPAGQHMTPATVAELQQKIALQVRQETVVIPACTAYFTNLEEFAAICKIVENAHMLQQANARLAQGNLPAQQITPVLDMPPQASKPAENVLRHSVTFTSWPELLFKKPGIENFLNAGGSSNGNGHGQSVAYNTMPTSESDGCCIIA